MGKRFLLAFMVAALFMTVPARAETKREVIVELLEMSGVKQLAIQMIDQLSPQLMGLIRRSNPNISAEYLAIADEEMRAVFVENIDDIFEPAIIMYSQEFTLAELQELRAFRASPVGQKASAVAPKIMQEMSVAGAAWGRVLGPVAMKRVQERLKNEGFDLAL